MEYLKVLDDESSEEELIIQGYVALWGGKDLTDEHFTPDTDFSSSYTRKNTVLIDWEHGHEPDKVKNQPGRDDILGHVDWSTAQADDIGLLARHVLDRRERYVSKFIEPLAKAGLLGSSSEATPKGIQKTENGHITKWPIKRQSLTVTPAEPRLLSEHQLQVIKSLANEYPQLKSLIDSQETVEDKGADKTQNNTKDNAMSEELLKAIQDQLTGMTDELKSVRSENAELKAAFDKQDNTPAPSKTGVIVTGDEADRQLEGDPFKSLGDFLFTLAHNPNDPRVKATKSDHEDNQDGLVGYHNVNKAIGDKAVSKVSPLSAPYKAAPTGLGESVPSLGGFLVGTDFQPGIYSRMYSTGQLMARADVLPISANSNSMVINAEDETSRATGSRRGGIRAYWTAEASEKQASRPKFRQMNLKLNKLAALVYVTDELLEDSSALGAWVTTNLPEEIRFTVEVAMLSGTGVGQPLGILNSAATVVVDKETGQDADTITYENLVKMWARRYTGARGGYVWMINQDVGPVLPTLNVATGVGGALVYMPPGGISGAPYSTLFGAPVIETEYSATLGDKGDVILAAWGEYQMIEKGGIQSASSIHVRFIYDETVFRFVYRVDGQPKWAEQLTPFQGTAKVSPFVTLEARA